MRFETKSPADLFELYVEGDPHPALAGSDSIVLCRRWALRPHAAPSDL